MDIQAIKKRNEISSVVGRYVTLSRKGKRSVGLCPFHDDRHPSLTVDTARQTFVCYACGARGDVVAFVQQVEGCSFSEAIEKLGGEGVTATPQKATGTGQPPKAAGVIPDHSRMLGLLLPCTVSDPALMRMYLEFEAGQAPHLLPGDWDYLKGRLVFPIRDASGRLVGFAGRLLTDTGQPKYLNTSAAHGYQRNSILYGLYRAKEAIGRSGRAFLTEGYKDCIAMHAAGFTNTVAVCGTELSATQVELLKGYTSEVVLLPDGDEAGQRASIKMARLLEEKGLRVYPAQLPEGADPDSLFTTLGMERFRELITQLSLFPHRTEYLLVTACLLFRQATTRLRDETVTCAGVVLSVMDTEQLLPVKPVHRVILEQCTGDTPTTLWPKELREIASSLENDYRDEVLAIRDVIAYRMHPQETVGSCPAPDTTSIEKLLIQKLLLFYLDARLKEIVRGLTTRLKVEKDPVTRKGLLNRLKERKKQHRETGLGLDE